MACRQKPHPARPACNVQTRITLVSNRASLLWHVQIKATRASGAATRPAALAAPTAAPRAMPRSGTRTMYSGAAPTKPQLSVALICFVQQPPPLCAAPHFGISCRPGSRGCSHTVVRSIGPVRSGTRMALSNATASAWFWAAPLGYMQQISCLSAALGWRSAGWPSCRQHRFR